MYLHVDDMLVITDSKSIVKADDLMNLFADTFQEGGLEDPLHERVTTCQIEKAVGYSFLRSPARLQLPDKKRFRLYHVFLWMSNARSIDWPF